MKKVIIYSTNWCVYCRRAKDYLSTKNIDLEEKNIEEDIRANDELMKKLNGRFMGVPVIDIEGQLIDGFDRAAIDAALGKD